VQASQRQFVFPVALSLRVCVALISVVCQQPLITVILWKQIAGSPFVIVEEAQEPADFWRVLGGHKEYPSSPLLLVNTAATSLVQAH